MKAIIVLAFLLATTVAASAQYTTRSYGGYGTGLYGSGSNPSSHYVQPHYTTQGVVSGHRQTNPNNTQFDNYSTRGNINPYTGQVGIRSPRW